MTLCAEWGEMCWMPYMITHQPALVTFILQQDDLLRAVWRTVRENKLYPFHIQPVQRLRQGINFATVQVTAADIMPGLLFVRSSIWRHCEACVQAEGRHFQNLLWLYTVGYIQSTDESPPHEEKYQNKKFWQELIRLLSVHKHTVNNLVTMEHKQFNQPLSNAHINAEHQ
jgi:hypothetical protein